jgi:hypothetical protein
MKNLILTLGLLIMTSTALAQDFAVGQVWEYETRDHEKGSTLIILKIDEFQQEKIIHISLTGLKIKTSTGTMSSMSHAPFTLESLNSSVTNLIGSVDELPNFHEGYGLWKEAFDSGQGGVFSISVKECVEFMEQTINK